MRLPPLFVKKSLSAHSILGVLAGALLYIICFTGTVSVFTDYFERWEQPHVQEFTHVTPQAINTSVTEFLTHANITPKSLYIILPSDSLPRMHIHGDDKEWQLNQDGTLGPETRTPWISFVKDIHYYLLLPHTLGIIIVSLLGVVMLALILSGLFSYPRLLKDAFTFRFTKSQRLEQTDLHNRLSIWGLPFHIMIAFTGALFGLIGIIFTLISSSVYEGNRQDLVDEIYGADPVIKNATPNINYAAITRTFNRTSPNATPIYWVIHGINTKTQFVEIAATRPNRLTYSEIYRFNSHGERINHQGLSDGPISRQLLYSIYRLHFGQLGHISVKFAFLLLGIMATLVTTSGLNIWMIKRQKYDATAKLWSGLKWGTPAALLITLFTTTFLHLSAPPVFFISLVAISIMLFSTTSAYQASRYMLLVITAITLLIAGTHTLLNSGHLWLINTTFTVIILALLVLIAFFVRLDKPITPS